MEVWDILDENGQKTGRTMVRGEELAPGDYYLAVHIWIKNGRGEYLIQRRAMEKTLWPGMWAATGGAAVAGEGSLQSACREVEEELGFAPDAADMVFLQRLKNRDWFTDVWLLEQDVALDTIIMQPGEVCDVRWAGAEEIRAMVARGEFVGYRYLDWLFTL